MSQQGHTDNFSVTDYVTTLEKYVGSPTQTRKKIFDTVLYNTKNPPQQLIRRYADEGEPVALSSDSKKASYALVGKDLLADGIAQTAKKDLLRRTLIRHDSEKLAKALISLI